MVSSTLTPLHAVHVFQLQFGCSEAVIPIGDRVLKNRDILHPSVRLTGLHENSVAGWPSSQADWLSG